MDQEKIWEFFQNNSEIGDTFINARPRYEYISKQIAPNMYVLNIGVGRGGLEKILLKQGAMVSCLDPSENAIESLRKQYALGDRAQVGFSQSIPFPDHQFDVVVMSEVLEHLTDDVLKATLGELGRVLKQGGRFIGTVPADENLIDNCVICPHCGEIFHRWGHLQKFSEGRLHTMLAEHFHAVKVSRRFFGEVRTLNWKGRLGWGLKKLLISLGVKGSGETFFFSANNP
jgi:SAM-dependent methyltransferase